MQVLQLGSAYMTRNPGEAHFTIEDLRAAVETRNTAVTRKILHFGRSLRGSPQYWFATKCNLSAMITQLGKPQLFVTLTLADSQDQLLDRFVPGDIPSLNTQVLPPPSNSTQFLTGL